LRHRRGWRQADLAALAGVSQDVVSLIERGRLDLVSLEKIRRIALELDAEFVLQLRWRGGDLDRLLDEGHASMVGRTAGLLRSLGWEVGAEVSYSIYGERGSIDLLAWHEASRTLLVIEVKTELVSLEETLRKHDEKARLARRVAEEQLGWRPRAVGRLLILPDHITARRRVARHAAVLEVAYPARGSAVRAWLRGPEPQMSGLIFPDDGRPSPWCRRPEADPQVRRLTRHTSPVDLSELEAELRAILVPYEDVLESSEIYGMEVLRRPGAKAHDWFAGVRVKGDTVKLMLLPMHTHPELLEDVSPEVRKRKTGASLLTLRAGDDVLIPELETLVQRSFDAYVGQPPGEG